jgi:hypothetical protein
MITFDPEGGDLGRASIKSITALEMQIVIPHVASILEELAVMHQEEKKYFKYAFEVLSQEKDAAQFVIHASTYSLPPRVFWYESDGISLFKMHGVSGGVVTAYICYLITK